MSGPWYVKTSWDRIYLMRHDLNPSTAQSECDRLNAEWEQAQVPVEVPRVTVDLGHAKIKTIDGDVDQSELITVQKLSGKWQWAAVVCGKYAARCADEYRAKEIAADLRKKALCNTYTWTNVNDENGVPFQDVQHVLYGAKEKLKSVTMAVIDEDVKPTGEPTITVEKIVPGTWGAVVNGKYYAPVMTETRANEIATRVKAERSSAGYGWCSMETRAGISSNKVDAEWPKLPVKEDIKTVVVNQDGQGHWRVVLNDKWQAGAGDVYPRAKAIETDTLNGVPCTWHWRCLKTDQHVDLRDFLNLKG